MKPFPEEFDTFRSKVGWVGESKLFHAAHDSHSKTHEKTVDECKMCLVLTKHLTRLAKEGEDLLLQKMQQENNKMETQEIQRNERKK